MMEIRPALAQDWPAIWPVLEPVFRAGETYALPRDIAEDEARRFWMGPDRRVSKVAVDGPHLRLARPSSIPTSRVAAPISRIAPLPPPKRRAARAWRRRSAPTRSSEAWAGRLQGDPVQLRGFVQRAGAASLAQFRLRRAGAAPGCLRPPPAGLRRCPGDVEDACRAFPACDTTLRFGSATNQRLRALVLDSAAEREKCSRSARFRSDCHSAQSAEDYRPKARIARGQWYFERHRAAKCPQQAAHCGQDHQHEPECSHGPNVRCRTIWSV